MRLVTDDEQNNACGVQVVELTVGREVYELTEGDDGRLVIVSKTGRVCLKVTHADPLTVEVSSEARPVPTEPVRWHVFEMYKGRRLESFDAEAAAFAFAREQAPLANDDAGTLVAAGRGKAPDVISDVDDLAELGWQITSCPSPES